MQALLAISIAMRMQRYNAGRIARWSTSRASLEATGCRHWSSACAVLPRRPPWWTNSNETHKTLTKHNFLLATTVHFDRGLFMRILGPEMYPLLSSSMRQALFKVEMPRLEPPKSSRTFPAIKHCQGTRSKKLLIDPKARMCAISG
jgi:hypothetical protein